MAQACTTFLLERGRQAVVGKSYDWHSGQGLVLVNKRGVAKQALLLDHTDKPVRWVARYGSLTFNQYGRELPQGGMNEAGLVVEIMWLASSVYPARDQRPAIGELQLIQYLLDRFGSVAEVARGAAAIRTVSFYAQVHYLACDRDRACVALEYLDGKLVATAGHELAAKTLTNDSYADSLASLRRYKGFGGRQAIPTGSGSLDRFARASARVAEARQGRGPIERAAFAVLDSVSQGDYSKWNIVYDPRTLRVWWRTYREKRVKSIDLGKLDLGCATPVKVLDMDAAGQGEVTGRLADYTLAVNYDLIRSSLAALGHPALVEAAAELARYPETLGCQATRR